ncbi:ADP-L-glycero-D-manno-heptose-6-epimerase [uncultured archaeon]|nr:ADP-L-glycero-D-manno-heptose-6-epimerase [uncultured archaeon]
MKEKNIIITGGAGFIGSNLVKQLADTNHVIVIDDLSTGHIKNIQNLIISKKIEFINGTITDLELLQKTFRNIDYIFHEAAIPSVPRSIKDPIKTNAVNVQGTLNILIAARDNHVKKVIYASSSSVYGDTPTLPKKEDMKPYPLSPYAVSKLTAEYYCEIFTRIYNLPTISLRYFNVYGPGQDPASEYAAVVPRFITNVLDGKSPIIYGNGEQTRDFTFIEDVVNANILAAESLSTGIFNIAGGKRISINDLALLIIKQCKKDIEVKYQNPRSGDILHSLADITRAKDKFNFKSKYSITEGIEVTIKWFLKRI